jgi:gliding motility-associated-like protein
MYCMTKELLLILLMGCFGMNVNAQTCTSQGQNPETAFPICGLQTFTQSQVKICGDKGLPGPCSSEGITDKNPYWYKFTCFRSGTLGFVITPLEISDDYDWQLFDITGREPQEVYSNKDLFVACNWSGETGRTGASSDGTRLDVCTGPGKALFSSMPQITEGHEYLLLISHFTNSQSGYTLAIRGGSSEITDTRTAVMEYAVGPCAGNQVSIKLNKNMSCTSLAADGSDFEFAPKVANILSATAPSCSGFDMDSVVLTVDQILPPGNYNLIVKKGSDGNSLLDICGTEMPPGSKAFTVYPDVSAAFNHQLKTGCLKDTLVVSHEGNNDVNYWNWQFDELTFSRQQNTSHIFETHGDKNISLVVSNGHCSDTSSITISLEPKINAQFDAPEIVCAKDKAVFTNRSSGDISQWSWSFGEGRSSTLEEPEPFNYTPPPGERTYRVSLTVANEEGCSDSAAANVIVVSNCSIGVPTAFTPNNDGRNDYLYPSNAFNAESLIFRVFNRFGQVVFETRDWRKKWDGTLNGNPQPSGTYVWSLSYILKATKVNFNLKGTTVLIR